ncbi:MAG TPA: type II toxin-antitoxin system HicB family antitoxin [Candidatus Limnocylindrales bacterium]
MRFEIYLESGPQRKKTWVYVPDLPGCSTVAPTSDAAIEAARVAIGQRLEFLRRHGDDIPGAEPIEIVVVDHSVDSKFLGYGQGAFPSDREALTAEEAARQLSWATWSRAELVAAARAQTVPATMPPPAGGRSAASILSHVAGSEWAYVSSNLGTLKGGSAAIAAIERAGDEPWEALAAEREALMERLRRMTLDELVIVTERGEGKPPKSARRMLRRLLEHEWEHVLELNSRLPGGSTQ